MLIAYVNAGERGLTVEEAADIAWPEPGPKHESHTKRASDLLRADYIEVVMVWDDRQGKLVPDTRKNPKSPAKAEIKRITASGLAAHGRLMRTGST